MPFAGNQLPLQDMKILPAFCMVLVLVLQSCETVNTPVPLLPSRFGRGVEFVAGVGKTVPPKLRLIEKSNGTVLAEAESLFTPDAIDCVGKPEGDGFVVLASGTGNTVAVYEDVSDASPENQIVLFMRNADGRSC